MGSEEVAKMATAVVVAMIEAGMLAEESSVYTAIVEVKRTLLSTTAESLARSTRNSS
jgi:hypothetical protein